LAADTEQSRERVEWDARFRSLWHQLLHDELRAGEHIVDVLGVLRARLDRESFKAISRVRLPEATGTRSGNVGNSLCWVVFVTSSIAYSGCRGR
jgi:hypothetical protein